MISTMGVSVVCNDDRVNERLLSRLSQSNYQLYYDKRQSLKGNR